jgi:hypothetical protein
MHRTNPKSKGEGTTNPCLKTTVRDSIQNVNRKYMLNKPTKCWRWKKTSTPYHHHYYYYWQWLSLADDALRDRVKRRSPGIWRSRARETWYKPKNRHPKNTQHTRSCCSSSTHHHHIQKRTKGSNPKPLAHLAALTDHHDSNEMGR